MRDITVNAVKAKNSITGEELPISVLSPDVKMTPKEDGTVDLRVYGETQNLITSNKTILDGLHINKIADYLYTCEYQTYDYAYAYEYFKNVDAPDSGACSALRVGNLYGRNLDMTYDNTAEFIIRTPAYRGFHKVLGVAELTSQLLTSLVDSGEPSELYKILPFRLMDGINDAGLVVNTNIAPVEDATVRTTGTNPDADISVSCLMLTRYILDRCATVSEAITELQQINIYAPGSHEYHYMIADTDRTVVIEFHNNQLVVCENNSIMTNFYLHNFDGNTATATFKSSEYDPNNTTLTPHACGVERYDILNTNKDTITSVESMRSVMQQVHYTKTYDSSTNPFWYSEYNEGMLTIDSLSSEYQPIIDGSRQVYENRTREKGQPYYGTWQTVHTSVYDMLSQTLHIWVQENYSTKYEFSLTPTLNGESIDVQIDGISILQDGVANIPVASKTKTGLVRVGNGLVINDIDGGLDLSFAGPSAIANRLYGYPVHTGNVDLLVKTAMCDGKGPAWTEVEQKVAQQRIGILSPEGVGF